MGSLGYLSEAKLREANLIYASLQRADLSSAILQEAKVIDEQLAEARSLRGATMPNGQKYEDWVKGYCRRYQCQNLD